MLTTPQATSFEAHYQSLVSSGAIEADPAQARTAEAFADLDQRLTGYKPVRARFRNIGIFFSNLAKN